jgi:hypothetical protein
MKWRELLSVSIVEVLLIALIVGLTFASVVWPLLRPQTTIEPVSSEAREQHPDKKEKE